jgi:hypothetical protein
MAAKREIATQHLALALIGVAIALVPWTLWLTWSLPAQHVARHWRAAWVGYDLALALLLLATGVASVRRSPQIVVAGSAAATLLLADAWFDVVTAARGGELVESVLEAVFAEIPLALVCLWIAYDAERFFLHTDRLRR